MSIETSHQTVEPSILYFGTPVVLVSTLNADGTANLAPMSSAWWLGWRAVLGFGGSAQTVENLRREGELVLNLPSADMVGAVDRIARTTGTDPVPPVKQRRGYRYESAKFALAGLDEQPSETVRPPRAAQCPVQMEAVVEAIHPFSGESRAIMVETRIQRVHVAREILADGRTDHVDPDRWRPLIMSFQRFYGLADGEVAPSRLAEIPEELYRTGDIDRARQASPLAPAG